MKMIRVRNRFEKNWRFSQDKAKGADTVEFDDSKWRRLNLPHDWSIEGTFDKSCLSGCGGGYLPGGKAWYRKTFKLDAADEGKRISIEFDGVYMNATVWINGRKVGSHAYGYTSFQFDLTAFVNFGSQENVLSVRVDDSKLPNSRWYSGAGIYRHVWLTVTDNVHVGRWGTAVSTVKVSKKRATISVETQVINEGSNDADVELLTNINGPDGQEVAEASTGKRVAAGSEGKFVQEIVVKNPDVWDVDSPAMYQSVSRVKVGGKLKDDYVTPFGIRTFRFDAKRGFILNGRSLKLKGVNMHHDNGCLGSVVYDRAEERRVELMKGIGANAIRCSHNPPSPEFLDACDRLGVVVIDEAFDEWEEGKLKYGYKDHFKKCWRDDLISMVMRDRNHPSVMVWSIGNEVPEQRKLKGARTASKMAKFVRKLDPTRPVGYGADPGAWTDELWEGLDVCGYNYRDDLYEPDHKQYPSRCVFGSETFALYAFRTWTRATDNDHTIGEFIWTGMDYIGESGIGHSIEEYRRYPVNTACCGELDVCGFKKTRSYYRDILWDNGTDLHIAVRRRLADGEAYGVNPWGWPSARSAWMKPDSFIVGPGMRSVDVDVDVYSACDEVELILNGETIGKNTTSRATRYMTSWTLQYEPGVLEAIGYKKGKEVAHQVLSTPGAPAKIDLSPDRKRIAADGYDLSFVTVEVQDKKGAWHQGADNEIRFSIKGPGKIVGVGNGDQSCVEPFQAKKRSAYNGRCQVVVKSTNTHGKVELVASSKGLASGRTVITTVKAKGESKAI